MLFQDAVNQFQKRLVLSHSAENSQKLINSSQIISILNLCSARILLPQYHIVGLLIYNHTVVIKYLL